VPKKRASIDIETTNDHQVVGGMSYFIDPNLKKRLTELTTSNSSKDCINKAQKLIECLGVKGQKVKDVKLKNANIEIRFK